MNKLLTSDQNCEQMRKDIIHLKDELIVFNTQKRNIYKSIINGLNILFNFKNTFFLFDKKRIFVFKINVDTKTLTDYGILKNKFSFIPKRFLFFLYIKRFYIIKTKFTTKELNEANIILIKPALEDGGSQIKLINLSKKKIISFIYNFEKQWLIKNEIYALKNYSYYFIPKLLNIYSDFCYARELIKGKTITYEMNNWIEAINSSLKNLTIIYLQNQINSINLNSYLEELKNRILSLSQYCNFNDQIFSMLEKITSHYSQLPKPEKIVITRVHGDFALKNILISEGKKYIIIDWERHSNKSIFFDLSNLLFKLDHHKKISIKDWLTDENKILLKWINIIIGSINQFNLKTNNGYNLFRIYYLIFLLERLELEFSINNPSRENRAKIFFNIWTKHLNKLL